MTTKEGTTNDHKSEDNKLEFYSKLKRSYNIEDLNTNIIKIINSLGFSDYSFIPLNRDWDYELKNGVLSSWPEEYWRVFQQDKLYIHDMQASFFRYNAYPAHTSHIYNYYADAPFDTEVTEKNRMIRQLQHSFGFYETYTIPVQSNSKIYLFTLSQQNMDAATFQRRTNSKVNALRALGQAIHAVCSTKFSVLIERPPEKVVDIAPKPLRVLATLANNDLSINEVARKLCISPITAHQHIAVARKAFGMQTNIGAIREAIKMGIISYNDD